MRNLQHSKTWGLDPPLGSGEQSHSPRSPLSLKAGCHEDQTVPQDLDRVPTRKYVNMKICEDVKGRASCEGPKYLGLSYYCH